MAGVDVICPGVIKADAVDEDEDEEDEEREEEVANMAVGPASGTATKDGIEEVAVETTERSKGDTVEDKYADG